MGNFFNFDGVDLDIPKRLLFIGKVPVTFKIIDFKECQNDRGEYLSVSCMVLDGEAKDTQHLFFISKDTSKPSSKRLLMNFLGMFAPLMEWKAKNVSPSIMIGKIFVATPDAPNEYNGKTYQNFSDFRLVDVVAPSEQVTLEGI